jgi:hypothetical protein
MKIPHYLMTSLAFVGAISLIIMACSADNSNTNTASTTSAVGKYQISGNGTVFYVIDTETGVVKEYSRDLLGGTFSPYTLKTTTQTQP